MGLKLTPLHQITVPKPKPDQAYSAKILGRTYSFYGLKSLLGAADFSKSGDINAKLSAKNEIEREAARQILSDLAVQHFYDNPLTDNQGKIDSIMRVNYDIDTEIFNSLSAMTIGELKDHILGCDQETLHRIGFGLTGVMIAAVTKIMDIHDLVYAAKRIRRQTKARTTLGMAGTLSSRVQPNHPTDDLTAITAQLYISLAMGNGDMMFGLNPSEDTIENISACLHQFDKVRRQTGAPTQICVLAHIKTQLACLKQGAPVEILFQSLAGTESTLIEEFDVTIDLLDEACHIMLDNSPLIKEGAINTLYFETGQGSEFSYNKHNGMDMTTTEALTYGLCRRYNPCMVNNVTGFIGPETHATDHECIVSSLQDHFMGKFSGLPMGMAPCYTLHSDCTMEGQQIATSLLTAAGANYYIDVYLGADRMLAYFDTSGHDNHTLKELYNCRPTPEFYQWCLEREIYQEDEKGRMQRGPNWGNPRKFCNSDEEFQTLMESIPQNYGQKPPSHQLPTAGPRMKNAVARELRSNMAIAKEAAKSEIRLDEFSGIPYRLLDSQAQTVHQHHNSPEQGSQLSADSLAQLSLENNDIQIVITDGLSAEAVHSNVPEILPILEDGLKARGYSLGQTIVVPHGRVKLSEAISKALGSKLVIMLLGERPGGDAASSRSMSAYMVYHITDAETQQRAIEFSGDQKIQFQDTVVNNIYKTGIPPIEAGALVAEKCHQILSYKAAGNHLNSLINTSPMQSKKMVDSSKDSHQFDFIAQQAPQDDPQVLNLSNQHLVSQSDLQNIIEISELWISRRTLLTPAAKDILNKNKIKINFR